MPTPLFPDHYVLSGETREVSIDWSSELDPASSGAVTISTSTWTGGGLTIASSSTSGYVTTAYVSTSGGTSGSTYTVTNTVVTSGGETLKRTLRFRVA